MSWLWLLWFPFPGAIVVVPMLSLISGGGMILGWLRGSDE